MIVPAVIPKSLEDVFTVAKRVKSFSRELHIDMVDGIFVDNISWPYGSEGMAGHPNDIRSLAGMFDIEIDLMIHDPLAEIPRWIDAGAKRLVVHIESCFDVEEAKRLAGSAGVQLGVAASLTSPLDLFLSSLEYAHYAQCMGIRHIGVQGAPFDTSVLTRIDAIKEKFPSMEISIVGSVNAQTISLTSKAGASRFIAGSAILNTVDAEASYKELLSLVHK